VTGSDTTGQDPPGDKPLQDRWYERVGAAYLSIISLRNRCGVGVIPPITI
jgi:hypothetical protein